MTTPKTNSVLQNILSVGKSNQTNIGVITAPTGINLTPPEKPISTSTTSEGVKPEEKSTSSQPISLSIGSDLNGQAASSASSASPSQDGPKVLANNLPAPAPLPTQEGEYGFTFDFNLGMRIKTPKDEGWVVSFYDETTNSCIFECKGSEKYAVSTKKYFFKGRFEARRNGELLWSHSYDATGKNVAIIMPVGTLGDPLGWFPYAVKFGKKHGCKLTVVVGQVIKDLLGPMYPDIQLITAEEFVEKRHEFYASYYIGLFFVDKGGEWQSVDFRHVGLHRTAAWILGVDPQEEPPRVFIEDEDTRPIEEPYVVIASHASCACKLWNNPSGWLETVEYIKKLGYRVICIDREPIMGVGPYWHSIPHGVEDETGQRSLSERARWLKHAEFFVGLSSGLSWLAWAVNTPVVMISGFTHPTNEFYTPYRVFSAHGCNSCWHDLSTPFKHDDYLFCPRHKGTERAFECTRIITSEFVNKTIDQLCKDHGYVVPVDQRV